MHSAPFPQFGIELEYMIVHASTLGVMPVADCLLAGAADEEGASDFQYGPITWSNELVTHVIELKTTEPARSFAPLADQFQVSVAEINRQLTPLSARLLPGGMHPWMDPARETSLWQGDNNEVYAAFDSVFDCRGHGWANLQSQHINLPFAGDDEFARLHAAIRLALPILPAIAASSPVVDGRMTGLLDNRLDVYRHNCARIPSVTGRVIPETVRSEAEYREQILGRMYADIAPFDSAGVLQNEWLNARGAIARFDRNTIEIRVLDVQECPAADLAVAQAVVALVAALRDERWLPLARQQAISQDSLVAAYHDCVRNGDQALLTQLDYLAAFGLEGQLKGGMTAAGNLWKYLSRELQLESLGAPWQNILDHGPLARRIVRALEGDASREALAGVYGQLADCLAAGRVFQLART